MFELGSEIKSLDVKSMISRIFINVKILLVVSKRGGIFFKSFGLDVFGQDDVGNRVFIITFISLKDY